MSNYNVNIKESICKNCGNKFRKRMKPSGKHSPKKGVRNCDVRPYNALTCSRKCSKEYNWRKR